MNYEDLKNLLKPLLNSNEIDGYVVGLTKDTEQRRKDYIKVGFQYFYIIETGLTQNMALELEKKYFESLTQNKNEIFYKKYQPDKRDKSYRSSVGGINKNLTDENYSIYIACYSA